MSLMVKMTPMKMNINKELIVIVGPTGSGKTDLSIKVAQHFNAPIISTDSRQLYRGLPIGTAQPSVDQLQAVEHHFIACRDINEEFNCGAYELEALATLEELFLQHDKVVAVGGSGLYIKALCEGMDDLPDVDDSLREKLRTQLKEEGLAPLLETLRELDPEHYKNVDRSNPSRILRALEVCLQSGKPYSSLVGRKRDARSFKITKVGIDMPRDILYSRIDMRVDIMVADGLEQEARDVYPHRALNALQTVGYREFFDYFDGAITRDEAIELVKRNSRRYAKRQMTWFRRDPLIKWFTSPDSQPVIEAIEKSAEI